MGDWTEFLIKKNGIEITAEGYILGSDSSELELSVLKQVDEGEWSYKGSEEFLKILQGRDSIFDAADNRSDEFYYHVVTKAWYVPGDYHYVDAEIERLKEIAVRVFAVIS